MYDQRYLTGAWYVRSDQERRIVLKWDAVCHIATDSLLERTANNAPVAAMRTSIHDPPTVDLPLYIRRYQYLKKDAPPALPLQRCCLLQSEVTAFILMIFGTHLLPV